MSEMLELSMIVDAVTVKDSGDKSGVTVVLKGQKTVTHETAHGYDMEDIAEITMTVKFGAMVTARKLGIEKFEDAKVVTMRDRDMQLQSFEGLEGAEIEMHPAMQQKIA